jgi:hypothetical protein
MKEVAHRVDKDHARPSPRKRLFEPFRPERQIESIFERMAGGSPEALGEALCITMITTSTDLRAARYRIPRRIRPLDCGHIGHYVLQNKV